MSAIVAMEGGGRGGGDKHSALAAPSTWKTQDACDRGRAARDTPSARQQKSSLRQRPQRGEQQRRTRRRPQREEPPPPPPPAPPAPEHENSYTALAGRRDEESDEPADAPPPGPEAAPRPPPPPTSEGRLQKRAGRSRSWCPRSAWWTRLSRSSRPRHRHWRSGSRGKPAGTLDFADFPWSLEQEGEVRAAQSTSVEE